MNVLKVMINNPFKECFYGEKKVINVLITFSISHKSYIKILLKCIVNHCPKGTH